MQPSQTAIDCCLMDSIEHCQNIAEAEIAIYNVTDEIREDVDFLVHYIQTTGLHSCPYNVLMMLIQSIEINPTKNAIIIDLFNQVMKKLDEEHQVSFETAIIKIYSNYLINKAQARFLLEIAQLEIIDDSIVFMIIDNLLKNYPNNKQARDSFFLLMIYFSKYISKNIDEQEDSDFLNLIGKLNEEETAIYYNQSQLLEYNLKHVFDPESIEMKIINGTYLLEDYDSINNSIPDNIFNLHFLSKEMKIIDFITIFSTDDYITNLHLEFDEMMISLDKALSRNFLLERTNPFYNYLKLAFDRPTIYEQCLCTIIATHNYNMLIFFLERTTTNTKGELLSFFKEEDLITSITNECLEYNNLYFLRIIDEHIKIDYQPVNYLRRKKGLLNVQNNCYLNVIVHLLFSFSFMRDKLGTRHYWKDLMDKYLNNTLQCVSPLEFFQGIGIRDNIPNGQFDFNDALELIFSRLPAKISSHFTSVMIYKETDHDNSSIICNSNFIRINVCFGDIVPPIIAYFNRLLRKLIKIPSVLIVTVNRSTYVEGNTQKDESPLLFDYYIDLSNAFPDYSQFKTDKRAIYELHSIILHYGNDNQGHYSILIKDRKNYCYYSDNEVSSIRSPKKGKEIQKNAHTFVYVLISPESIKVAADKPFAKAAINNEGLFNNFIDVVQENGTHFKIKQSLRKLLQDTQIAKNTSLFNNIKSITIRIPNEKKIVVNKPASSLLQYAWDYIDVNLNGGQYEFKSRQREPVVYESLIDADFILIGTNPFVFEGFYASIVDVIEHKSKKGPRYLMSYRIMIFIFFFHLRTGCTLDEIDVLFGYHRSTVERSFNYLISKAEIIKNKCIIWKSKDELREDPGGFQHFPEIFYVVDSTSNAIYRPKNQSEYYSGKVKACVMKAQTIHDSKGLCLDIYYAEGKVHDKKMLEDSPVYQKLIADESGILMDSGYQGSQNELHSGACFPIKKSGQQRMPEEIELNRFLASDRIIVENWYGRIHSIFRAFYDLVWRSKPNEWKPRFTWAACFTNFDILVNPLRNDTIECAPKTIGV